MTTIITPGRWRGLKTTSNTAQRFAILAFDLPKDSGLLMALEATGYRGDATSRQTDFTDDWTVGKIKRMGASAVKLLAYYHPGSGALAEEIESMIQGVVNACHQHDIPLFLEPICYSLDESVPKSGAAFAATRPDVVRETAQRLSQLGPDVLKLEFPVDVTFNDDQDAWRAACAAVSEASEVPWVLLSAGVDFETFEGQARVACQAGASGFLAGRAIWKESIAMSTQARARFLQTTATRRIQTLSQFVDDYARPWTDFYVPIAATAEWFKAYPAG